MNRRTFLALFGASAFSAGAGAAGAAILPRPLSAEERLLRDVANSHCVQSPSNVEAIEVASSEGALTISGSRLVKQGFLDPFTEMFSSQSGIPVKVLGGGCDDGITPVVNGQVDLGAVCCDGVWGLQQGILQQTVIARDLKAVVVHPDNPIGEIDMASLQDIVQGRLRLWQDLGLTGKKRKIALVVFEHCNSYEAPIRESLLGENVDWPAYALRAKTDEEALNLVARFPNAIGINSWVIAAPLVAAGRLKVLALNGQLPVVGRAPSPSYPLTGPFALVHRTWRPEVMEPFFETLFSPIGQQMLSRTLLPVVPPAKFRA